MNSEDVGIEDVATDDVVADDVVTDIDAIIEVVESDGPIDDAIAEVVITDVTETDDVIDLADSESGEPVADVADSPEDLPVVDVAVHDAVDVEDVTDADSDAGEVAADSESETVGDVEDSVVDVTDKGSESLVGGDGPSIESALEAILMVSDQPMTAVELATLLAVPTDDVESTLLKLAAEYVEALRGFELRMVDGGWRFFSAQHCAEVVAKFATDGRSAKLTQAALETLAVVAYKQPVSRARIGAIRGVNVDGVMRTLMTRGLVSEIETDPATGAVLYGTTGFFLERMGLASLADLPPIEDHLPDLAVLDELIEPGI